MVFQDGLDTALRRFRTYMPYFTGEATLHKFPPIGDAEEGGSDDGHDTEIKRKRLVKVIKNYYTFYKTGEIPAVLKDKSNVTKGGYKLQLKL